MAGGVVKAGGRTHLERAVMHPTDPVTQKRTEARKVAQQFEAVMVRSLVGAMRQTAAFGGDSSGLFGSGPGADTYSDWFDQNIADELGHSGKVGIADVLMHEFERWKQIPAAPAHGAAKEPAPGHARRVAETKSSLRRTGAAIHGGVDVAA